MVGVPGRSQGCHTCRRRKIKCDLAKPNCERCVKSGRECEGYARGAVFLNRTPQGMLKRQHLEEAAPRESSAPKAESSSQELPIIYEFQTSGTKAANANPPSSPGHDVYATIPSNKVVTIGLENYYMTRFVPLDSRHGQDTCGSWPYKFLGINNRGQALDNAFAALALNRAGRDQNDVSLVLQGRKAYGRALIACSRMLQDPVAVKSDWLLVSCNLLKLYEIQEATDNTTDGHDRHTQGLTNLILQRGRDSIRSECSRNILDEVRFNAMIVALQTRKRHPLGEKEWWRCTWTTPADVQQNLYDNGFVLAGVAEDADAFSKRPRSEITPDDIRRVSGSIVAAHEGFKAWHRRLRDETQLQLEWPNCDALPLDGVCDPPGCGSNADIAGTGSPESAKVKISPLRQRLMMMDFWALRIGICMMTKTFEQSMSRLPGQTGPQRALQDMMLSLSENIAATVHLCMTYESGLYGQSRSIFALRIGRIPTLKFESARAKALRARFNADIATLSSETAKSITAISTISESWRDDVDYKEHVFFKIRPEELYNKRPASS